MSKIRTRAQAREEFASKGWSIAAWAKKHSFSPNMVYTILADDDKNPRVKCLRGDAHNIAVQLRLKAVEVSRDTQSHKAAA